MQAQAKFCLCVTKINTKLFSAALKLPKIPKLSPSFNTKQSFL